MTPTRVTVADVVAAPPAIVYRILADYVQHHPKILPKPTFTSLAVEEGGVGAGTRIRVEMSVMGAKSTLRMRVAEPEPGRVLEEVDEASGVVTRFTVTPEDGGARSRVEIATEWAPKPGLRGWGEKLVNAPVARSLYKKELKLLDQYAQTVK